MKPVAACLLVSLAACTRAEEPPRTATAAESRLLADLGKAIAGSRDGVIDYVHVDALVDDRPRYTGRVVKVHGVVTPGTVMRRVSDTGDYVFELAREGRRLPVHLSGPVPDTFAEGAEVVVTGQLATDRFEATEMAAKCPSRYETQATGPR